MIKTMKAIIKYLKMLIWLTMCSFSTCVPGPTPEPPPQPQLGVVGRWSTDDGSVVFYFDKDYTGTLIEKVKDSNGNSVTIDYNFVYTYNESSGVLKIGIKGASSINNFEVNLTGNTMMLTYYRDNKRYSLVLTRK